MPASGKGGESTMAWKLWSEHHQVKERLPVLSFLYQLHTALPSPSCLQTSRCNPLPKRSHLWQAQLSPV